MPWRVEKFVAHHACAASLIKGSDLSLEALEETRERTLVRTYKPDSLGTVWASLATVLRGPIALTFVQDDQHPSPEQSPRPARQRNEPQREGYVPWSSVSRDSNSPSSSDRSSSVDSSVGYNERLGMLPVEDATVRLAGNFMRLVLNYGGSPDEQQDTAVEFRDARQFYSAKTTGGCVVKAIDDGGLVAVDRQGQIHHVAMLEAKRNFQTIIDGSPTVSDEVLAQMVLEALALALRQRERRGTFIILAVQHYLKFFRFKMGHSFTQHFEALAVNDENVGMESHLIVDSTAGWMDLRTKGSRKRAVNHLVALSAWAKATVAGNWIDESDEDSEGEDSEDEDSEDVEMS